ncbi:hypothetical protein BV898_07693 [Hypsibius exemplaris]|uniref:Uncharacterized protein n=1 Tax=Hypsibius exemplaris TaxID=2072580 RepID=A0A1W0WSY8_HYPEX|nr:hypothetical protein BV898_07693 [Hypsibius exemplaris]
MFTNTSSPVGAAQAPSVANLYGRMAAAATHPYSHMDAAAWFNPSSGGAGGGGNTSSNGGVSIKSESGNPGNSTTSAAASTPCSSTQPPT